MQTLEITSLSSRGQVVIPQGIRDRLHLFEGEKFVIIGEEDTIILKKLEVPSFKGFDKLLLKTREFVQKKGLKPSDVEGGITVARGK
ncbi:AbrB/MazE/SpoVT family DNA-binding domain-containing protein [Candidatus Woesearchaeota archaeon]|nr:AbrB/MazE/SpoVT family DNA-binding domain-containing protein [Candidatus Woesearchaeota archaeon]